MTDKTPRWFHCRSRRFCWALAGLLGLVALSVATVRVLTLGRSRVSAGIVVGEVPLGQLSFEQARREVSAYLTMHERRTLVFAADAGSCSASLEQVGAALDIEATMSALRDLAKQRRGIYGVLRKSVELVPRLRFDSAKFDHWILECERKAIKDAPVEGRIFAKESDFVIQPARAGRRIDKTQMPQLLARAVVRPDDGISPLPLVEQPETPSLSALERARAVALELVSKAMVLRAEPTKTRLTMLRADLAKLLDWRTDPNGELVFELSRTAFDQWLGGRRHRVEQRARDATYEAKAGDRLEVVAEQQGSRIATDRLFSDLLLALRNRQHQLEIPFEPTEMPKRVVADLAPLNIHEPVGSFSTRHACCQARVKNIHRIADMVNGTIVLPGETFSLNDLVGQRSLENGFVPAPTIEDGEMVDTIGGGVSQFATTFYNAVLRAGYEVLERQAHTYWFDRYPMGHEATLSWPKPDVVIRNDTQSGLLILTSYTDTSISVRLFGDREGRRVDVSVSPRFDIVRNTVEYLPNPEQDPEKEKIKEPGSYGWSVWTMRTVTLKDGSTKKDKRKVIYKPRIRRVEVHPCKIPKDEPGYTGEKCPEPQIEDEEDESAKQTKSEAAGDSDVRAAGQ